MNDLDTIAPVTTVKRKRQQRLFRAWQKFEQQLYSRQQFLRAICQLRGIRFVDEFQRLLQLSDFMLTLCIATCLYLRQLLTDFQIFFIDTLCGQFAIM